MAKRITIEFVGEDGVSKVASGIVRSLDDVDEAASGIGDGAEGFDRLGDAAEGSGSKIASLASGLEKLAALGALKEVGAQIDAFVTDGARVNSVADAFGNLASSAGLNGQALLGELRTVSKGYIDDVALMQASNKALLNGSAEMAQSLPQLMRIAQASAKATGQDVGQLFGDLVEGLTKAEPEILDNLGLTINLTEAYATYAQQVGKSANDLSQAEKAQALLNATLQQGDQFIQKVGGGAVETGGSLQRLKTDVTNLKNEIAALSAIGLEDVLNGGTTVERSAFALAIEDAKSYQQYVAALAAVGQETDAVNRVIFEHAAALHASGMATSDATAQAQSYSADLGLVEDALMRVGLQEQVTDQQRQAVIQATLSALAANTEYAPSIELLTEMLANGEITIDGYMANMEAMIETGQRDEEQKQLQSDVTATLTDGVSGLADILSITTDATYTMSDADYEATLQKLEQAAAAEQLSNANATLEDMAYRVTDGNISMADASSILAGQMGLEDAQVRRLIASYIKLHAAKAQGVLLDIGASIGVAGLGGATDYANDAGLIPTRSRRRSGGGRSGKSEAVKAAEREAKEREKLQDKMEKDESDFRRKLEKIESDYASRVNEIHQDYLQKLKAATEDYQNDQQSGRAGFYGQVARLDQESRASAVAAYEQYWAESNQMAQAGLATEAKAYLDYAEQVILDRARRADNIRQIDQQLADDTANLTAQQRADLEEQRQLYAEENRLATDNENAQLDRLRNADDSLKQNRDQALEDAQSDYTDASQKLYDDFLQRNQDIKDAYGDLRDANAAMATALIADYAAIAEAASAAAASAAAASAAAEGLPSGDSGPAPEARYMGGPIGRGRPYLVGDNRGQPTPYSEIVVPDASSYVLAANEVRALVDPARSSATSSTTINQNQTSVTLNSRGRSETITLTPELERQILALINQAQSKSNRRSTQIQRRGTA